MTPPSHVADALRHRGAESRYDRAMAPIDVQTASTTSSSNATRSSCTTRWRAIEKDPRRAGAFRADRRATSGATPSLGDEARASSAPTVPPAERPRPRVRFIILARAALRDAGRHRPRQGPRGRRGGGVRRPGTSPEVAAIAADEREHAEIWDELRDAATAADVATGGDGRDGVAHGATRVGRRPRSAPRALAPDGGRSGTLRAVIFGVSDGLVSNLSLVMGVAGAAAAEPGSSCSPASPACSPGRSAWPPASTSRCRASASSSSARSRSSAPRWRRCPRRRRPSWPPPTGPRASPREEAARDRPSHLPGPRDARSTRSSARSSGLDPDQLGSPFGAAGRVVRGVRDRGGRCRSSRTCSAAAPRLLRVSLGAEPGRAVRGRRRR